ncbi:type I polyketide synthase, partial [Luteibacter sp. CQ10]|uniref:type I polyketide synthase n=1 Tax=Luteibacter sp. CQ10 TaxID=2805821 RepID=UPI0034A56C88
SAAKAEEAEAPEALSFQERWEPAVLPAARATPRRLLVIGTDAAVATAAATALGAARAEAAIEAVAGEAVAAAIETAVPWEGIVYAGAWAGPADAAQGTAMYAAVQALAAAGVTTGHLVLCAAYADGPSRAHAESWIGLERSLGVLVPDWTVTVLVGEGTAAATASDWAARVWTELAGGDGGAVHRAGAVRERLRVVAQALADPLPTLRQGGVYWITGGAGGLGLHVARHLRERYAAKLVLSGRRALDEAARATLAAALGETAWLYVAADVSDASAMGAGVAEAVARWGAIEGVVHAAGVLDPAPLTAKTASALAGVLAAKVDGSAVLDTVMAGQPLAFVCYFSSSAAVLGDFGGGDYAMGNRFQMAWAQWVAAPGAARRVAINWPLWAEGGMRAGAAEHTRLYLRGSGQVALPVATGLAFFERALGQPSGAYLLMHGRRARIESILRGRAAPSATVVPVEAARRPELRGLTVEACLHWELKQQVSELLKLPRAQIRAQTNLADFGFDSISLAQWARQLSAHYGVSLTPALFFSHATLEQVGAYLWREHRAAVAARYATVEAVEPIETDAVATTPVVPAAPASATAPAETAELAPAAIAIVGLSGRFPQARDVAAMWRVLAEGREVVAEIGLERFDWREGFARGVLASKWLGAMPGVEEFDPAFFEISPREAQGMDPRQRLLLQEAWNALEDAGHGPLQLATRSVGTFVGVEQGEYQSLVGAQGTLTGTHDAVLAARLAYVLNLQGPSMALNTSCSSGLVALHQACLSLRAGECDTAIAAAASLSLTAQAYAGMSQAGMLSPDGRCYAFDQRANGMVPGEAVVAVVLRRLERARAEGDPVYAVIRASGTNYDGKTNGITAPNGARQAQLIERVYRQAGVAPSQIDYVVTHGTGTRLGDPVEIEALRTVFGGRPAGQAPCALTSTKSNFGHSFAASGLVSLVGAVMALRHGQIPASVNAEQPSDYVAWQDSGLAVNTATRAWPAVPGRPRRVGVSAFGMSGTNAHVLLEEAVLADPPVRARRGVPLLLSARSAAALRRRCAALRETLAAGAWDAAALTAMSHTLACGRHHFEHRCAVVVDDREHALDRLDRLADGERLADVFRGEAPREFVGQPAQQRHAQALFERLESALPAADEREILHALADLHCQGYTLPWARLFGTPP